jgi:Tol biopolymer transport system component/predicted Ser/Thr protein kinase
MALTAGTRLGPYEIVAPIGAGGMGQVYRASDTRLHRTVAVKVAADQFSERFEREARAVAALNHGNICQIYDVGANYLVMEFIEGQPLKGPLPLDRALMYAGQISDALDAAHRKNITHRDLKPANILVTKGGIKLLDFGLAKIVPAVGGENTTTMALTAKGELLGTLNYMSPEQLQGRDADARSDIFALGLVLYEMLTGRRAFEGESPASVIAAILERPAPSVAEVAPAALDRVLQRCLAKDPDDRWQTVRDLKAALGWVPEGSAPSGGAALPQRAWRGRAGWITAAGLLAALLALIPWRGRPTPAGEVVRFAVYPPEGAAFSMSKNTTVPVPQFAVSPDGRTLAFAAARAGALPMLWLRSIEDVAPRPLPGTEDCERPFWSPDGQWLGFFSAGKLKKVPASGGHTQVLAEGAVDPRGATWGPGSILFGVGNQSLQRVPADGGLVTPLTKVDASQQEVANRWPQLLPDGEHFLFTVRGGKPEHRGVFAGSLDGKIRKFLVGADSGAFFAAPGTLLWVDNGSLLGQELDTRRLELKGQPVALVEGVGSSTTAEAAVSLSGSGGTLAYSGAIVRHGRLSWFDRGGNSSGSLAPDGDYTDFRLSPDGKYLATSLIDPKTSRPVIWLTDLARGSTSRFTLLGADFNASPVWSPDGAQLMFRTTRNGVNEFYRKSAFLGGSEERILSVEDQRNANVATVSAIPMDWSSDGRYIIYFSPGKSGSEFLLLPCDGAPTHGIPVRFLSSASEQMHANFSPDGRLVAYTSNESGTFQVYVQTFPLSNRKWPVSTKGGYEPRWRKDGREIYYLSEDGWLNAVPVGAGPSFGVPKPLFRTQVIPGVDAFRNHYVVTGDGQRFLINTQIGEQAPLPITVVLNWTGLKR